MQQAAFKRNQFVRVPCQIAPGPLDELLITVDTANGPISGFVKSDFLEEASSTSGYITGQIVAVSGDSVKVKLPGSFFTTTGVASLATAHLNQSV